jgi:hypothetical protein
MALGDTSTGLGVPSVSTATGSEIVKVVPAPGWVCTSIEPPAVCAML